MEHYAGIDVSLEWSSICVVDALGKIVKEAKISSETAQNPPDAQFNIDKPSNALNFCRSPIAALVRSPISLARRVAAAACAAVQSTTSLVRPAASCARNVSGYPRSSSNSYHAANAERTETIACSRGGIGRAPRSEVSRARDRSGP